MSETPTARPNAADRLLAIRELGVLAALLLLCLGLKLSTTTFAEPTNLLNVARAASYYGIMGVGMVFVITLGDIDLSVGSIVTLTNVAAALALQDNLPVPVAILIGLGCGALCGMLNGVIAVRLRIPMIIVTLGTLSVYRGFALMLSNASAISRFSKDNAFFTIGGGKILGVPTSAVVMVIAGVLGWLVLTRTRFGRHVEAIGGNPSAARLAGISIPRYRIAVMTLNGLLAAVAGVLNLAFLQSADTSTGEGFELWVIASAIIGGTALSGGQGTVPGAILGALIISVIKNGLVLLNAPTYAATAVTGAVIILAVAIDSVVANRQGRKRS